MPIKNLTGMRFGKLVVEYQTKERADGGSVVWHCRCDCGNEKNISSKRLLKGKNRSCGCLNSPPLEDYIGQKYGHLTIVEYAGKAKDHNRTGRVSFWKCQCDCGNEITAAISDLRVGDIQSCGCRRYRCHEENSGFIDDTYIGSLKSSKVCRANNTSGKTGVSWEARKNRWSSYITFKKKRYFLGYFDKLADAVAVRSHAEEMHDRFLVWFEDTHSRSRLSRQEKRLKFRSECYEKGRNGTFEPSGAN